MAGIPPGRQASAITGRAIRQPALAQRQFSMPIVILQGLDSNTSICSIGLSTQIVASALSADTLIRDAGLAASSGIPSRIKKWDVGLKSNQNS